jgi:hypothetical protein
MTMFPQRRIHVMHVASAVVRSPAVSPGATMNQREQQPQPGRNTNPISPRTRAQMQRRVGRNLDEPPVTTPAALEAVVRYHAGEIAAHTALGLLVAQGVALPEAWLAVGKAYNIRADVIAEGIVGTQIGADVRLTTAALDGWLAQIRDTELETHIARGLWLINQLKPVLSAHDFRELKARYVVHDMGKLGPPSLPPAAAHLVLQSFELRRIVLQHMVTRVFEEHFGPHSHQLIAAINRHAPQTRIGPQTTMRMYFDYHETWGGQRLATLYAQRQVSRSVARHAHLHHHLDHAYTPLGLITYLNMYEASTGRMSYNAVTGQETRCHHGEAMAAIWQRFDHVDRRHLAPGRVAEYAHLLTMMDRLAPHLLGSPDTA